MRVLSATNEREADCACGSRLSFWPADVARAWWPVPDPALAAAARAEGKVGYISETRGVQFVLCPCCGAAVEVGEG